MALNNIPKPKKFPKIKPNTQARIPKFLLVLNSSNETMMSFLGGSFSATAEGLCLGFSSKVSWKKMKNAVIAMLN